MGARAGASMRHASHWNTVLTAAIVHSRKLGRDCAHSLPSRYHQVRQLLTLTDASPNHTEAMTLFRAAPPADADLPRTVEWVARRLITLRPRVAAVIRAGPLGCCYVLASDIEGEHDPHLPFPPNVPVHWVPPYWNPSVAGYAGAVVDPTGAGNAFMGGLVAALDQGLEFGEGEFRRPGGRWSSRQRVSGRTLLPRLSLNSAAFRALRAERPRFGMAMSRKIELRRCGGEWPQVERR